ncbi:MAG: hypothetical protein ACI4A7_06400, partial [Prevotella sp.]
HNLIVHLVDALPIRNSLFLGSHKGVERGAMFYSLVCPCRTNGVNVFEYISDVINKAATLPPNTPLENSGCFCLKNGKKTAK